MGLKEGKINCAVYVNAIYMNWSTVNTYVDLSYGHRIFVNMRLIFSCVTSILRRIQQICLISYHFLAHFPIRFYFACHHRHLITAIRAFLSGRNPFTRKSLEMKVRMALQHCLPIHLPLIPLISFFSACSFLYHYFYASLSHF